MNSEPTNAPGPAPSAGSGTSSSAARRPGSRQWLPLIIVVVLAFAIVVPPLFNLERYQHRISDNIGRSLGRPVHFSHISLRLLPRPGFDLSDFTVEEGPGFGAEPILRSASVSASIRLLSLWRGRLEIARIALDEPSLNLVRNIEGRWNFASVVTQASRTPIAPTGQTGPGRTLRFPYIEATNARVNFKYSDEKQPFSFLNGDLAIWLENPSEWQLRFKAQPARTDLALYAADTGLVRVEGSLQRAASLGTLPVNLRVTWERAPLGQVSRLFAGADPGWRGDLDVRSRLQGTPDTLLIQTTLDLTGLHRVEFAPDLPQDYSAKCSGTYQKAQEQLGDLNCLLPLGNGSVSVSGTFAPGRPSLEVAMQQVPAVAVLNFLRLARRSFGQGVKIDGDFGGHFSVSENSGHFVAAGSATADKLAIRAAGADTPLVLNSARITALPPSRSPHGAISEPVSLLLAPVRVDLGAASPLVLDGRFDRRGFALHIGGNASLARLVPLVHSVGLLAPGLQALQPTGDASLDVGLRGPWLLPLDAYGDHTGPAAAPASVPSGTITLHNASLATSYLSLPLAIKTAQASLFGAQIAWSNIVGQYGPVRFTGTFRAPLPCVAPAASDSATTVSCVRQFDLAVASLDVAALPGLMEGNSPLMQTILHRIENPSATQEWPALHGTLRAASATLGTLTVQDAVVVLDLAATGIRIDSLDARALEGALHITGTIQPGSTPAYSLDAQLNQASAPAIAQLFPQNEPAEGRETWGPGTVNAAAHLTLRGVHSTDLRSSVQGTYHFDWSKGGLHPAARPALESTPTTPFTRFDHWTADGAILNSALTVEQSLLTTSEGAHAVQGTIGFDRRLDLKWSPASSSAATATSDAGELTGTLAEPVATSNGADTKP